LIIDFNFAEELHLERNRSKEHTIMPRQLPTAFTGTALLALCLFVPVRFFESRAAEEPSRTPSPAAKDKLAWKKLFDGKSLTGWKSSDFAAPGKVHVKDGAIVMEKGKRMTGITYTKSDFPKIDYEVTLEAKRIEGEDFFCTTTFPVADAFCSFVVAGWHGTIVGLSSIDDMDASANETTKTRKFKNGRWYRIRIRVSKNRIQSWIDDKEMVDFDTTDRRLSIRLECGASKPFGMAAWDTTGAVRDIRVRTLSDAEKKAAAVKNESAKE
jgi:hypothetical protein